jgi:hypothetical protein
MRSYRPQTRTTQLLVQELPDEVLVYDMERNEVHCLNGSAARVWGFCDGEHTVAEIASLLATDLDQETAEKLVWVALEQFAERHLLEEDPSAEGLIEELADKPSGMTRREMVVGLSVLVGMIPVVESIMSPPAALAASFGCSGATDGLGSTPCNPVV